MRLYLHTMREQAVASDLAEALCQSLSMYWRKVGGTYFLAISPGDPRRLSVERFFNRMTVRGRRFLGFLCQAGQVPGGLDPEAVGVDVKLADLPETLIGSLASQLQSNGAEQKEVVRELRSGDGPFATGTIRVSVTAWVNVYSPSAHSGAGGLALTLGG
jgi:hypothetical protein